MTYKQEKPSEIRKNNRLTSLFLMKMNKMKFLNNNHKEISNKQMIHISAISNIKEGVVSSRILSLCRICPTSQM